MAMAMMASPPSEVVIPPSITLTAVADEPEENGGGGVAVAASSAPPAASSSHRLVQMSSLSPWEQLLRRAALDGSAASLASSTGSASVMSVFTQVEQLLGEFVQFVDQCLVPWPSEEEEEEVMDADVARVQFSANLAEKLQRTLALGPGNGSTLPAPPVQCAWKLKSRSDIPDKYRVLLPPPPTIHSATEPVDAVAAALAAGFDISKIKTEDKESMEEDEKTTAGMESKKPATYAGQKATMDFLVENERFYCQTPGCQSRSGFKTMIALKRHFDAVHQHEVFNGREELPPRPERVSPPPQPRRTRPPVPVEDIDDDDDNDDDDEFITAEPINYEDDDDDSDGMFANGSGDEDDDEDYRAPASAVPKKRRGRPPGSKSSTPRKKLKLKMRSSLFACVHCTDSFSTQELLETHMAEKHADAITHKCKTCTFITSSEQALEKHQAMHDPSSRQFRCRYCDESFLFEATLNVHVRKHTTPEIEAVDGKEEKKKRASRKMLMCELCRFRTSCQDKFDNHVANAHKGDQTYFCDRCAFTTHAKNMMDTHVLVQHNQHALPFGCDFCDERFLFKTTLDVHMAKHGTVETLICDICGKVFKNKNYLQRHLKTTHADHNLKEGELEPCVCEICGKGFKCPKYLRKHMRFTHSVRNEFNCDLCGKSFKHRSSWDLHKSKHCRRP